MNPDQELYNARKAYIDQYKSPSFVEGYEAIGDRYREAVLVFTHAMELPEALTFLNDEMNWLEESQHHTWPICYSPKPDLKVPEGGEMIWTATYTGEDREDRSFTLAARSLEGAVKAACVWTWEREEESVEEALTEGTEDYGEREVRDAKMVRDYIKDPQNLGVAVTMLVLYMYGTWSFERAVLWP